MSDSAAVMAAARKRLAHRLPELPAQPGYLKRRRRLSETLERLMGVFAGRAPAATTTICRS